MTPCSALASSRLVAAAIALALAGAALAQGSAVPATPAPAAPVAPAPVIAPPAPDGPLADLAWLAGCWRGTVNQREFREHWMPLRGNLMLGTGQTVAAGRTQDYEYMRLETRGDAVHYVAVPNGQRETSFLLAERTMDGPDTIYTFANPEHDFPQRIVYRRGSEGWLYVHVEGRLRGEERRVIWPMRRIDCESGDLLRQ
jgi:hypothetical protein